MAELGVDREFWRDRSVLVTGHTGFKGGWLALWLNHLGARVHGYSLPPNISPSLFESARIDELIASQIGDVRDYDTLAHTLIRAEPDIVFHLAAQALVREGYRDPIATVSSNVMGTAHLLEAVRQTPSVRALVLVTSDKCYQNREWHWPYREDEALGGKDPYSASKACAEILAAAWRYSYPRQGLRVATARAGNVIGGGDWAADRLLPDAMRAWVKGDELRVRYPQAIRPWQHVLEALHGYLMLAQRLYAGDADEAWNFGPSDTNDLRVGELLDRLVSLWGDGARWVADTVTAEHEATLLRLDSSKARSLLGWQPRWSVDASLARIVEWYRAHSRGEDARALCLADIRAFEAA